MTKLEKVTVDELRSALESASGKKPTQRLMLAIIYKQGPSVPMIAEWFDIHERTIYDWFDRMEEAPIDDAIHDERRPGRPSKLAADQREAFEAALEEPATHYGFDEPDWTPEVAREVLREEFDVDYSRRHVQRLLNSIR